jgi:hypothetical protein
MFSTMSFGSSRITISWARKPIVLTRSSVSVIKTEPVSAMAKGAHDCDVNVRGVRPIGVMFRLSVPGVCWHGRTNVFCVRKLLAEISREIRGRMFNKFAGHVFQLSLERRYQLLNEAATRSP